MKKLLMIIPLVILLCFAFGCQQGEEVAEEAGVVGLTEEDLAAIKALGPALDEAALAGDWDAIVAMFTEDGLLMPPNGLAIKAGSEFKAWIESQNMTIAEASHVFSEIDGYGDIAYVQGTYAETLIIEGVDDPVKDEGKILTILRKQSDGSWLFAIWMSNSDLPLPE